MKRLLKLWKSLLSDLADVRTIFLSLLPGLFWLAYLRSLTGGRGPKWWHWLLALGAGWGSTLLTLWVSDALAVERLQTAPRIGGSLLYFVVGVGLVEEGAKALCAVVALKLPRIAERPMFALQLCGGVALGFATAENVLYARSFGDSVLLARFVFSTLGHVLFSSVWGFALGGFEFSDSSGRLFYRTSWRAFVVWLLVAALGHGLYDWFLLTGRPILAMLSLLVLWCGFRESVLGAYLYQSYQREVPFELEPCPCCTVLTRARQNFCSFCGERLSADS